MAGASSAPTDALGLLGAALQAQDSQTEELNLRQLLLLFQTQPGNISPLLPSLLDMLNQAGSTLKRWIVDVIDLTFCKPTIGPQARSSLAYHMPEPILALLNDDDLQYAKVAITAFASCYQPLFRLLCTDQTQARLWPTIQAIKQRILHLFEASEQMGIKLAAIKAFQKIILVQTRATDARGQAASRSSADANIAQVPQEHPILQVVPLEQEANDRVKQILTIIFVSSNPDLVMASMNCLAALAKMRSSLSPIVFEALVSWTPSALVSLAYVTVRSVETTLRLLFQHFHPRRNSLAGPYATQIIEAVDNQRVRMETAARAEQARKEREQETAHAKRSAEEALGASALSSGSARPAGKRKKTVRFADTLVEDGSDASTPIASQSAPSSDVITALPPQFKQHEREAEYTATDQYQQQPHHEADPMLLAEPDPTTMNPMATFDATTLPLPLITELIMANLSAINDTELESAITRARARINGEPSSASTQAKVEESVHEEGTGAEEVAQDPLNLDMGEEETLDAAERQLQEASETDGEQGGVAIADFTLKPPSDLSAATCMQLMQASVERIYQSGAKEEAASSNALVKGSADSSAPVLVKEEVMRHAQLWTVLITRLATRGLGGDVEDSTEHNETGQAFLRNQSDAVRELMLRFVTENFPLRHEFALQWMAEEFHCQSVLRTRNGPNHREASTSSYAVWLQRITASVIEKMDPKDKTLHDFLSRVPLITSPIISTLQSLCLDKTKMAAGFTILRHLAIRRVPARSMIGEILLGLTRNREKPIRGAAIITVRNWVRANRQGNSPAGDALERKVMEYAKQGLQRLTVRQTQKDSNEPNGTHEAKQSPGNGPASQQSVEQAETNGQVKENGEDDETNAAVSDDDGQHEKSALDDPEAEIRLDSDIVRLVELPFALCMRVPDMLDEIFAVYASLSTHAQESIEKHITPLIQNLGPNNAKVLSLIQHHPQGTDSLAVRMFNILGERNRSKKLVDLAKQMAEERTNEIDPRFLIPILPDLEKAEIIKYLPRIVSILSSEKAEDRTMLKNIFTSIVQPPEQGFGSVSTNLPRARQSELLSAVELMSLLHHAEPEIGRKTGADAIRICFGMTDIFRSEVIAAVLNHLIEEPELPVLFMLTAIIAVRTYKSLSSYISTIFLSRLITKKVWQQPVLWDGFKICAKQTAPASFGALVQLPREQLRDVIAKQPDLRAGLREYLIKKAGGNKARLKSYLETLGEGEEEVAAATAAAAVSGDGQTPGSGTSTPLQVSTPADAGAVS